MFASILNKGQRVGKKKKTAKKKKNKKWKANTRKMNLTLSVGKMRINHIYIRETTKSSGMGSTERRVKMRLNVRITDISQDPLPKSAQLGS